MIKRFVLFTLCLIGLGVAMADQPAVEREVDCSRDMVCIQIEKTDDNQNIVLYAQNKLTYDVTVTFEAITSNMKSDSPTPLNITVSGQRTSRILTLRVKNPRKAWTWSYRWWWCPGSKHADHDDDAVYELPFESGSAYPVSQGFNGDFSHEGSRKYAIDFSMPEGTPITAARAGEVVGVDESRSRNYTTESGAALANFVIIEHSDGTLAEYLHLKHNGAIVEVGDHVVAGQRIAYSGNTGFSTEPHLHFMVYWAPSGKATKSVKIKFRTEEKAADYLDEGRVYRAPYREKTEINTKAKLTP